MGGHVFEVAAETVSVHGPQSSAPVRAMTVSDGPALTPPHPSGSFRCPRSAGREPANPVRTPQVAAVSAVIVAVGSLGHFFEAAGRLSAERAVASGLCA